MLLLDCSKAFDRVNYEKLFEILKERGCCPSITLLLLSMYLQSSLRVKWQNSFSKRFKMFNGVKQGGVMSPKLFTVYIDKLFQTLEQSGYGCYVFDKYCGVVSYADDIALIAASKKQLEKMAEICVLFAKQYDLLFNASKSEYLIFDQVASVAPDSF